MNPKVPKSAKYRIDYKCSFPLRSQWVWSSGGRCGCASIPPSFHRAPTPASWLTWEGWWWAWRWAWWSCRTMSRNSRSSLCFGSSSVSTPCLCFVQFSGMFLPTPCWMCGCPRHRSVKSSSQFLWPSLWADRSGPTHLSPVFSTSPSFVMKTRSRRLLVVSVLCGHCSEKASIGWTWYEQRNRSGNSPLHVA